MSVGDATGLTEVEARDDCEADNEDGEARGFEANGETGDNVGSVAHLARASDRLHRSEVVVCVVLRDGNEEERHEDADARATEEVQVGVGQRWDVQEVPADSEEAEQGEN